MYEPVGTSTVIVWVAITVPFNVAVIWTGIPSAFKPLFAIIAKGLIGRPAYNNAEPGFCRDFASKSFKYHIRNLYAQSVAGILSFAVCWSTANWFVFVSNNFAFNTIQKESGVATANEGNWTSSITAVFNPAVSNPPPWSVLLSKLSILINEPFLESRIS